MMAGGEPREYNEKNVRYETAVVLPKSRLKSFVETASVVTYRGVDVYVFPTEQDARDWMDDVLKSYFWTNREKLIQVCKSIVGPNFRYAKYTDLESLMKYLTDNYQNSNVVPNSFRRRFRSEKEGKKYIYDAITSAVKLMTNADYRLSQMVFDYVDMDALVADLEAHLGMRVFKQGSFYYVIDLFPRMVKQ